MRKIIIFIFGIIAITYIDAKAQDYTARANLDTNTIRIGEQIQFTITVKAREAFTARFPQYGDTLASPVEVLRSGKRDSAKVGNIYTLSRSYTITCFSSGGHDIPPQKITVKHNNTIDTVETNSAFLTVNTVEVDTSKQKLYDIKPPLEAPMTFTEFWVRFWPYVVGAILLGALIWLFVVYRKRRKQKAPEAASKKPEEPPHVIALRALDELEQKQLWQKDKVKAYYSELTEILRAYINGRYQVPALERTSDEILENIRNQVNIDAENYEMLKKILYTADLVKFAKMHPAPDENDNNLQNARAFVKNTFQLPSAEAEEGDSQEKQEESKPEADSSGEKTSQSQ